MTDKEGAERANLFITHDKALGDASKTIHSADLAAADPERAFVVNGAQLLEFVRAAGDIHALYLAEAKRRMTTERAEAVAKLRVDSSWRTVAAMTAEAWGADAFWSPPSNQLAGIALCQAAASVLGTPVE